MTFPFFSIIIPTYNRPQPLRACLESLARLDYPRDRFEVIVVDDGSEIPPDRAVSSSGHELDVTFLTQAHAGPAVARNTGAARAQGEYLAFTDDDCAPASDWLRALAARLAQTPDAAIAGRVINALPDNPYSSASQLLISYLNTYYNADPDRARFLTSNNLALPADRFHALGGFDKRFSIGGEDRDLCDHWLYQGHRVIYAPEVLVYHAHWLTLRGFWRQHFNYGRGGFHFHRTHAQRGQDRIRFEPLSFYLNLLRAPASPILGHRAPVVTALLLLSQIANAAGFFGEWFNHALSEFR
jgi:GT2 family glycosyltransferase